MIALMSAVAAMTRANWRYIWPVMPGMKAAGRNTAISTRVMPMMGANSSRIASIEACFGAMPRSMLWLTPSTTTMASSTTMPIASTTDSSVRMLIENPIAAMAANAPMIVTGTVVAGTRVARQFCRNTRMTISTRMPASIRVR